MAFVVGQIVRPTHEYMHKDGIRRDFSGLRTTQGRVTAVLGVIMLSGDQYWDPVTSTMVTPTLTEAFYDVDVWDPDSGTMITGGAVAYPESQLEPGTAGEDGTEPITELFDTSEGNAFNLIATRVG
jgi:hypothetical protein